MESIAADYRVSKNTVSQTIQWVENALNQEETFKLPGKKVLTGTPQKIQYIVVDVTESLIQRTSQKTQVIINRKNRQILDIQQEKGSVHDFKLYKTV